jgi:hypothetical protein
LAFFNAVRSAERCARLRTVAARAFRMFFFADAMFGTGDLQNRVAKNRAAHEGGAKG